MRVRRHRAFRPVIGEPQDEGQRGIVQRKGRCSRHRARHVGDAIMDHAFLDEHRVVVRCRTRGFEAAPLIDGNIDQDRSALHRLQHVARDQLGCSGSRHQHGTDHQMRALDSGGDRRARGILRLDLARKKHVEFSQPVVVDVVNRHIGAHADGHLRGIHAGNAAAEDGDPRRSDARNAAEQYAASALFLFQIMRTDLHRHAAGDFRHGLQQGQGARFRRYRFIGNAGRTRSHQALCLVRIGGEVKIGEQRVPRLQHRDFGWLRFLDLHDHVGRHEDFAGIRQDARACVHIVAVAEIDAVAGQRLDHDLVPRGRQFGDRGRREANPIFVVLDLFGNTNAHRSTP